MIKKENLINLKNAIDDGKVNEIIAPTKEWCDAFIMITSDKNDLNVEDTGLILVKTRHVDMLSGFFNYANENLFESSDYYIFGFMALLAHRYINATNDGDLNGLLAHIVKSLVSYFENCGWENSRGVLDVRYDIMKGILSNEIIED